ncbi:carnitine dehydratase [Variovorax sp. WS11]|uniref:CaiB/BaiF CoA transferase family protein n=1 Tax=Variovorax sp. WS11 TaxID=1105204 RepID=UPI000D0D556D|nr:CaiB/BaiF CoA-transferase family protein [Variovorax sp. WS11]NDZ18903.1 CoA transferase [Variovorax sp. WS11]PSL80069.1 carnitine dehydratase [Variovorax sp. WS11]
MSGPLSHLTVIELAGIGPGPFACMLLADMGAKVIRIDRIPSGKLDGGDLEELMRNDGIVDRGRQSIAINTKDARGVEAVLRLARSADIFIEGFRPGVAEKLGLGPKDLQARNPKLIYGRMTGWGQTGPLAQAAGHDINYIALSGALHSMGAADRPPVPPLNLVGDYGGGGMLLVVGVLAAYAQAQHSGQGQIVDAAMADGAALLMAAQYGLMAKGFWHHGRESNFLDGAAHFYGTYECADGRYVSVGAIEPQFYAKLMQICEITDPHFHRQWEEREWPALRHKLATVFRTRTRDAWCELLEGSDACFAPVLSMAEAPSHPHNVARGTFATDGGVTQPTPAPRFDRTPSRVPRKAPHAGQHSTALLAESGFGPADIAALVAAGVVHDAGGAA